MNKKKLIIEGKTKEIWQFNEFTDLVEVKSKTAITANDDPAMTREFEKKAKYANNTTCRVFESLRRSGIPVAYRCEFSMTSFIAEKCTMIPLEMIARRYAVGSYLKRKPEYGVEEGLPPQRFEEIKIEFFLKTTHGSLVIDKKTLVQGLDYKKGEEDPLIINPYSDEWVLTHSKKPFGQKGYFLERKVMRKDVLGNINPWHLQDITKKTFLILEKTWNKLKYRLIDFKIEFGITHDGEIVVSDVIDNDSWRLRTSEWEDVSKESYRQGENLTEVEKKYKIVSDLTKKFKLY